MSPFAAAWLLCLVLTWGERGISPSLRHSPPQRQAAVQASYARRFRMWSAAGEPIALVAYRFTMDTTTLLPLQFELRQADRDSTVSGEARWSQGAVAGTSAGEPLQSSGTAVATLAPEWTRWTLRALDSTGAEVARSEGRQALRGDGAIALSDLIVGVEGSGTVWTHGDVHTIVALTDSFRRTAPLIISYQVRSATARSRLQTSITVTDISDAQHGKRVVQLFFTEPLAAGVTDLQRTLSLSRNRRGRYLVELQVGDLDGGGAAVRPVELVTR
jgi:hypothetical protein